MCELNLNVSLNIPYCSGRYSGHVHCFIRVHTLVVKHDVQTQLTFCTQKSDKY